MIPSYTFIGTRIWGISNGSLFISGAFIAASPVSLREIHKQAISRLNPLISDTSADVYHSMVRLQAPWSAKSNWRFRGTKFLTYHRA